MVTASCSVGQLESALLGSVWNTLCEILCSGPEGLSPGAPIFWLLVTLHSLKNLSGNTPLSRGLDGFPGALIMRALLRHFFCGMPIITLPLSPRVIRRARPRILKTLRVPESPDLTLLLLSRCSRSYASPGALFHSQANSAYWYSRSQ